MPIFEYLCKDCGKTNDILVTKRRKKTFWARIFKKPDLKCNYCGSKKLARIYSAFTTNRNPSTADMLNDIGKMGPVNFTHDQRPIGPPPGGCPYAQQQEHRQKPDKKIDRIQLS